jgi:hypothetical protein
LFFRIIALCLIMHSERNCLVFWDRRKYGGCRYNTGICRRFR